MKRQTSVSRPIASGRLSLSKSGILTSSLSRQKPVTTSPVKHFPVQRQVRDLTDDLGTRTRELVHVLHDQQAELFQVNRKNLEMESHLQQLEAELKTLKRDQTEADQLISNLIEVFACTKANRRGQTEMKDLERQHPELYGRLRLFKDRLEHFLDATVKESDG